MIRPTWTSKCELELWFNQLCCEIVCLLSHFSPFVANFAIQRFCLFKAVYCIKSDAESDADIYKRWSVYVYTHGIYPPFAKVVSFRWKHQTYSFWKLQTIWRVRKMMVPFRTREHTIVITLRTRLSAVFSLERWPTQSRLRFLVRMSATLINFSLPPLLIVCRWNEKKYENNTNSSGIVVIAY